MFVNTRFPLPGNTGLQVREGAVDAAATTLNYLAIRGFGKSGCGKEWPLIDANIACR